MKTLLLLAIAGLVYLPATKAQLPSYVPVDGLVGWWPFNGNANDESGNGNNGLVDGAKLTADRFGDPDKAYSFDGNFDKIIVPSNSSFDFAASKSFSASYWIKPSSITLSLYNVILAKQEGSGTTQNGWVCHLRQFNKTFEFRLMSGPDTDACWPNSGQSPDLDKFYHVVNTFNNGQARIYVNGELIYNQACSGYMGDNNANFHIGMPTWAYPNTKGFTGIIDDIGIWNRALSQAEVTALYEALTTDIQEPGDAHTIRVFPNPAASHVFIEIDEYERMEGYSIRIDDATGRTLYRAPINRQRFQVDIAPGFSGGVLFVSFLDKQNRVAEVRKIVVQ
jgi:hypothetical protein